MRYCLPLTPATAAARMGFAAPTCPEDEDPYALQRGEAVGEAAPRHLQAASGAPAASGAFRASGVGLAVPDDAASLVQHLVR